MLDKIRPISPYMFEILNMADDQDVSLLALGRNISFDPILSARLVKLCNAPLWQRMTKVESPIQAVFFLGRDKVAAIILSSYFKNHFSISTAEYDIWNHSLTIAYGIQTLIRTTSSPISMARGFTAGLFHDIGKIVLEKYQKDSDNGTKYCVKNLPMHNKITAALLNSWAIHEEIVNAVAHQDCDLENCPSELAKLMKLAHCLDDYIETGEYPSMPDGSALPIPRMLIEEAKTYLERDLEAVSVFFEGC
jgi:HD-like signal output (HDOD) protein